MLQESEERYRMLVEQSSDGIFVTDPQGRIVDVNTSACEMLSYTREEILKLFQSDIFAPDDTVLVPSRLEDLRDGKVVLSERRFKSKDGRIIPVEIRAIMSSDGSHFQGIARDITERKREEEALRNAEENYRNIFENSVEGIFQTSPDGHYLIANPALARIYGFPSSDELIAAMTDLNRQFYVDPNRRLEFVQWMEKNPKISGFESKVYRKDGSTIWVSENARAVRDDRGSLLYYEGTTEDITARRQAEEGLREAHDNLELQIQERTAMLARANGLLQALMDHIPDHIYFKDVNGHFVRNSKSQANLLGLGDPSEVVGKTDFDFFPHAQRSFAEEQEVIRSGTPIVDLEEFVIWPDGRQNWVSTTKMPWRDQDGKILGVFGISRDITERKQAEYVLEKAKVELENKVAERTSDLVGANAALQSEITERKRIEETLRESEAHYRMLFASNPLPMWVFDVETLRFVSVNDAAILHYGYSQDEFLSMTIKDIRPVEEIPHLEHNLLEPRGSPEKSGPWLHRKKDRTLISTEIISHDILFLDRPARLVLANDITERKNAENALQESEERFRSLFENATVGLYRTTPEGRILLANPALIEMLGYASFDNLAERDLEQEGYEPGYDRSAFRQEIESTGAVKGLESAWKRKDGTTVFVRESARAIRDGDGELKYYEGTVEDISERKQAEEQIRRQLDHLTALSDIDRAITSSFDLRLSLAMLLTHVVTQLGVDAADVLIFNPTSQMLVYAAGRGFRTSTIEKAQVRLGESYAGRAAIERHLVQIPNLKDQPEDQSLAALLAVEDFACYYAVPLIAKGEVKGVLEVFHRTPLESDRDWLEFLTTLAGQAAIAIDNSTLFDNLQRSNTDLALAYDATIEGWSHALDLRDKETEGHTQRVTDITLRLARTFGLGEKELVQVRWGALLHDIGKMGVPDGILLKQDPLTEEEWVAMKKHPTFAYELLSPIRYLRNALDIPYCHHEKWDGSGYPRGLKGEQIPLTARIFAVVDIWDALISDRPYRSAWTRERALEHIRGLAGTHLDMQVVNAFIEEKIWE
jgi:PAS domain S-box-containing protein